MNSGSDGREVGPRPVSNLRLRIMSALVLAPVALLVVWLGGLAFSGFVGLVSLLLLREWTIIVGVGKREPVVFAAFGALLAAVIAAWFGAPGIAVLLLMAGSVAATVIKRGEPVARWVAEGIVYSGLSAISLIVLRNGEAGLPVTLFLVGLVWATDIAAYFVGRSLGGPKLWPRISPKKTWSGAIGGATAAMIVGAAAASLVQVFSLSAWLAASLILSIFSQCGDLLESSLKRRFGVKDSGSLIPGHGGIMDRVDGLVAAAVLGYAVAGLVSGDWSDPVGRIVAQYGQ